MPSLRTLLYFGSSLFATQNPLQQSESVSPFSISVTNNNPSSSCPADSPLSCHNDTLQPSCCFIAPGGQFLLTQFWDTNPSIGPVDSWTLHGLWFVPNPFFLFCGSISGHHLCSLWMASVSGSHNDDDAANNSNPGQITAMAPTHNSATTPPPTQTSHKSSPCTLPQPSHT